MSYRDYNEPEIFKHIRKGDFDAVEQYVNSGGDLNVRYTSYYGHWENDTPLHYALYYNRRRIAAFLLEHMQPGDLCLRDHQYYTPLHYAAENRYFDIIDELINKHGVAKCLKQVNEGRKETPLMLLLKGKCVKSEVDKVYAAAELMIRNGVDVEAENTYGETALYFSSQYASLQKITELLINSGAKVNHSNQKIGSALFGAVANNNLKTAEFLLKHGARIEVTKTIYRNGHRPIYGAGMLHLAMMRNKNEPILKFLFNNGYDRYKENERHEDACACLIGDKTREKLQSLFVSKIFDPQHIDSMGRSYLHHMAAKIKPKNLEPFLKLAKDFDIPFSLKDTNGKTALDYLHSGCPNVNVCRAIIKDQIETETDYSEDELCTFGF